MAEREALQREIEQLQNLIKNHKRVHGDAPSSSAPWFSSKHSLTRGRGHRPSYSHSYSSEHQPYAPHPTSHWRKTYSLNNKTTRASGGGSSQLSEPHLDKTQLISSVPSIAGSLVGGKVFLKGATEAQTVKGSTAPLQNITGKESLLSVPATSINRTVLKPTRTKTEIGIKSNAELAGSSALIDSQQSKRNEMKTSLNATTKTASDMICDTATSSVPSSEGTCAFNKKNTLAQLQAKSHFTSSVSSRRTVIMTTASEEFSSGQAVPPRACSSPAANLKLKSDSTIRVHTVSSPHKKSQFTWVKSQGTKSSQPSPTSSSVSTATAVVASIKPVHGSNKKIQRKPSLSSGPPKTSKYSWVSSSCSTTAAAKVTPSKLPNKQLSPKALKVLGKATKEGLDGTKKLASTPSTPSKRTKVSGGTSTPPVSHANRYCWKAAAQSSSTVLTGSTLRSSRKGSLYRWTAQKEGKDSGLGPHPSRAQQNPSITHLSNSGFKLRSRTKIIRRYSNSNPAPEKRPSLCVVTLRSRYSLRRKTHTSVRTPTCAKRGQSRALVSIGRHKLRRLSSSAPSTSAWTLRTGPSSPSVRSPASLRVIKTRYKIDTRRAQFQHHNPALSYRVKRIQSARILLQSRLQTAPDRQWRGRSMRWIGGALYRVSANKLSRTHTTSTSSVRSGKWFSSQEASSPSSVVRTSNMRHVASRVVQRSLAIIRQARQKKQHAKQYCMYYNRFGKCNRGNACPYIHDPDKVAVCTRFLRGTCKQTDGTCPFSHKVSKEKMPVCSYFLKGICNNSSCPYSHVYVSRKAAVCQDFVRGYCPQGEKCKKKHTLVCPEFSSTGMCPKGSKCKLQHRQRAKRTGSSLISAPAKKARTRDSTKSPEPSSTQADESTPSSGLAKLPSFISLSSSPDTPEAVDSPKGTTVAGVEATGKKLHIKPRF
ncbi:zinc finger CCCH domain-containing protein 3 [Pygocentrus nattereri]|uniref:Zinc finger CCCH domain-containing protein 3 n=1 Tax=Pygocentrus nattereri TaxID=42514 RepID=A0A3B4DNE6_PYGNA|nr:zinc finger CCCH domain-containing protein 3 [Pygocentrus nattereri]